MYTQVLFHTAGIVVLTLLVNATTVRYLLDTLGLSDISNARRLTMVTAIRRITEAKGKAMRLLKSDRFLADAHWEVVDRKTVIENPFDSDQEDEEVHTCILCTEFGQSAIIYHLLYIIYWWISILHAMLPCIQQKR